LDETIACYFTKYKAHFGEKCVPTYSPISNYKKLQKNLFYKIFILIFFLLTSENKRLVQYLRLCMVSLLMLVYSSFYLQNDLIHAWGLDRQLGYCAQVTCLCYNIMFMAYPNPSSMVVHLSAIFQGDRMKNVGVVDSEYIVHLGLPTLGGSNGNEASDFIFHVKRQYIPCLYKHHTQYIKLKILNSHTLWDFTLLRIYHPSGSNHFFS